MSMGRNLGIIILLFLLLSFSYLSSILESDEKNVFVKLRKMDKRRKESYWHAIWSIMGQKYQKNKNNDLKLLIQMYCYKVQKHGLKIYKTITMSIVLYGCKTWSLTTWEGHRRIYENGILRRIFGLKKVENGECCSLYTQELHIS